MKIAIIQSCYIPWKGYFDIINDVDTFVFLDNVQFTKRDWRSRNLILSAKGPVWLTIPVHGGRSQSISDTKIVQGNWQNKHLKNIQNNYTQSKYFYLLSELLHWMYGSEHSHLSNFNQETTKRICSILGSKTTFVNASDLKLDGAKDTLLINICKHLGAKEYLSGPSARAYINPQKFSATNIKLSFKDYSDYPEYPQRFPPFTHHVSILDLLFNCGPNAADLIWGHR